MKGIRKYVYYADLWVAFSINEPCKPMGSVIVSKSEKRPTLEEALDYLKERHPGYNTCHYTQDRHMMMLVKEDKSEFLYLSNIRRGEKVKETK